MNERHYERKFYHDLLNLASSLRGISEVIHDVDETMRCEMLSLLGNISGTMIETINARRYYRCLEANDLTLIPSSVDPDKVLKRLAEIYAKHTLCQNKAINIKPADRAEPLKKVALFTDKDLLQGALGFGVRTALETISKDQTVTLEVKAEEGDSSCIISFSITFPGSVPPEEEQRVFQKPTDERGGMTGVSAYAFYALITGCLKGAATWTAQGESIVLTARFEVQPVQMK